jgi:dipeptidyl aminopeptidase/acylaminoacyl peptidase
VAPRLAIAVVCAAVAAAVLIGGGGSSVPRAAGARPSPPLLAFTARTRSTPRAEVFALRRNGSVEPLTHGPGRVVSWSPDGRELLVIHPTFDSGGGEALEALSTTTGRARPLWQATTIENAAWSPDGRYIAVAWDNKVSVLGSDGEVVRALGEQVPAGAAAAGGLAWSSDGSRLAVTYATPGGTGIAIEQPRGVLPRIMSPCGDERPCHDVTGPDWAAGSDALAMIRGRGDGGSLWWWTGRRPPAPLPVRGLPGGVRRAAWAPDGHRIAVATAAGLVVVPGPGARANRVTATEPLAGPTWSADGRLIAVVTRSQGGGPYVLDVLAPGSGSGPAFLQTSTVFERISGPLVWNPAG